MSTKADRIRWLAEYSAERRRERAIIRAAAIGRTPEFRPKVGKCPRKRRTVELLARLQGGVCYLCGKRFDRTLPATIEHVVPRFLGGGNPQNRLAACEPCNVWKGNRPPHPCELIYLAAINAQNRPSGGYPEPPSATG